MWNVLSFGLLACCVLNTSQSQHLSEKELDRPRQSAKKAAYLQKIKPIGMQFMLNGTVVN
jgi:hypothetical protein